MAAELWQELVKKSADLGSDLALTDTTAHLTWLAAWTLHTWNTLWTWLTTVTWGAVHTLSAADTWGTLVTWLTLWALSTSSTWIAVSTWWSLLTWLTVAAWSAVVTWLAWSTVLADLTWLTSSTLDTWGTRLTWLAWSTVVTVVTGWAGWTLWTGWTVGVLVWGGLGTLLTLATYDTWGTWLTVLTWLTWAAVLTWVAASTIATVTTIWTWDTVGTVLTIKTVLTWLAIWTVWAIKTWWAWWTIWWHWNLAVAYAVVANLADVGWAELLNLGEKTIFLFHEFALVVDLVHGEAWSSATGAARIAGVGWVVAVVVVEVVLALLTFNEQLLVPVAGGAVFVGSAEWILLWLDDGVDVQTDLTIIDLLELLVDFVDGGSHWAGVWTRVGLTVGNNDDNELSLLHLVL